MWYTWNFSTLLSNVSCVRTPPSYIFNQQENNFFSAAAEPLVMYVPVKQPQGLLCSKCKLHECCITFTRSHEYLNVYNVLLGRTHGHLGLWGNYLFSEDKSLWKLNMATCLPDYLEQG